MTVYQASIQSIDHPGCPAQRLYKTSERAARQALALLVREFGPTMGIYEARVMKTDSAGWMTHEVVRLA